jgi:hypothetical protein
MERQREDEERSGTAMSDEGVVAVFGDAGCLESRPEQQDLSLIFLSAYFENGEDEGHAVRGVA